MAVVYIDLLFLLNLVANYLLLLGSGRIVGSPLHRGKIALGAAMGALYSVAVFLPGAVWLSVWPCKLAFAVLMVLIAFGGYPGLLKVTATFFAASAALAGVVLAAELLGKTNLIIRNGVFYTSSDIRLLLLVFVICYFLLSWFFRRVGRHGVRETVGLNIELSGRSVRLTALVDSGHSLTDPVTNRTVVIADCRYVKELLPERISLSDPVAAVKQCREMGIRGVRLIPYRAVGIDCGMLLVLKADMVTVGDRKMKGILVALSPTPVDDGGGYHALIGGDLW